MVLIAARPSVGKTAFALNIAANVAINHGKKVAIFSLEMPADLLAKRMLCYISRVESNKMDTRGGLTQTDYKNSTTDTARCLRRIFISTIIR